jgi:cytidylate kinase
VARAAARALGFAYIDTGALYRAVGLAVLRAGGSPKLGTDVEACLPGVRLELRCDAEGEQRVFLGAEDVSEAIRSPEASAASSDVAGIPAVRAFLLETQRGLARARDSILDGRDIGSVVLPEAQVKIFLTASPELRARRRWLEQQAKGIEEPYGAVLEAVMARDAQDSNRAAAPLKRAEGSVLLDSSEMDFEETVRAVVDIIQKRRTA